MKFLNDLNKAILHYAMEKGNIEILKILLECKDIDVNQRSILEYNFLNLVLNKIFLLHFVILFLIQFQINFNTISLELFQFHSKSNISIRFLVHNFNMVLFPIFKLHSKICFFYKVQIFHFT